MFFVISFNSVPYELDKHVNCSSWPLPSVTNGCSGDTEDMNAQLIGWKLLDKSMHISQTDICELRCRQQNENGCCYLSKEGGCYWKGGGNFVTNIAAGSNATATACSYIGISFQV